MIETDRVAPVVFAALCVLALGASATSLQSTVSTDPSEVINLDYDRVPIGRDQASEIRKEVEASAPDPGATSQRPPEEQSRPTDGGQSDSQMLEQAQTGDQQIRSQSGAGPSSNGQGGSFTTWLVGLSLLLLALCVLAYRYRRRLAALLSALTDEDRPADPASQLVVDVESSNPVYLAWGELVDSIDVETPTTKTPRESATVAIDAGYDPQGVRELTGLFERVRYGDGRLTADRRARLESAVSRLDIGASDDRSDIGASDDRLEVSQ